MAAAIQYTWGWIAPGATVSVFHHGWLPRECVVFSATPYALSGQAYYPLGKCSLEQGMAQMHVDGTIGRTLTVHNLAPFNPCNVEVSAIWEGV